MSSKVWLPGGVYVIDFALYRPQVAVFKTEEQAKRLLDHLGHDHGCLDGALGITGVENNEEVGRFVWCYIPDSADISTIAHEAVHIAHRIMDMVGWQHDTANDEPFAYMVGYIAEKLHKIQSLPMHTGKPKIV